MNDNINIRGYFTYEIFKKDNYGIYHFSNEEIDTIVSGNFSNIDNNKEYELSGYFFEHPKYGLQFKVNYYNELLPTKKKEMVKFLSSKYFKGIGRKKAEKIVEILNGREILTILEDENILNEMTFLKDDIKILFLETLRSFSPNTKKMYDLFVKAEINIDKIRLLETKFGDDCYDILTHDPYILYGKTNILTLNEIDKLALVIGIEKNNIHRIACHLSHVCSHQCFNSGDTFISKEEIYKLFLRLDFDQKMFEDALNFSFEKKYLYLEDDKIYHSSQYLAEKIISNFLKKFNVQKDIDFSYILEDLKILEKSEGIKYAKSQKNAILNAFKHNFSIITGGPGTGKTTIIKAIIKLHKMYTNDEIVVLAPTGRAAKRINELNDVDAKTIHSLLKWNKETNTFNHNHENPLFLDTVIIDEFSMVDNYVFSKFIDACGSIKKIIVIGDHKQLPSLSPGNLLLDLIESKKFVTTTLSDIYRQEKENKIIKLCNDIILEDIDFSSYNDDVKIFEGDFFVLRNQLIDSINDNLLNGYDWYDIQVVSPMYKGNFGIDNLNIYLQQAFNPKSENKKEFNYYKHTFRVGDKILQIKNQTEQDVYNGDIGKLVDIIYENEKEVILVVDFDGNIVYYKKDDLTNIKHGYAISIHKSQGSEYKIVYIICDIQHSFMLQKQILYTAVSRSKERCFIVGDKNLFKSSCKKCIPERKTGLIKRFKNDY